MIHKKLLMAPQVRDLLLMGTWQGLVEEAMRQWWADWSRANA